MVLTMMRLYQNMLVIITIIVMNRILIDLVDGRSTLYYGFNYRMIEMQGDRQCTIVEIEQDA